MSGRPRLSPWSLLRGSRFLISRFFLWPLHQRQQHGKESEPTNANQEDSEHNNRRLYAFLSRQLAHPATTEQPLLAVPADHTFLTGWAGVIR